MKMGYLLQPRSIHTPTRSQSVVQRPLRLRSTTSATDIPSMAKTSFERSIVILPGLGNAASDYERLKNELELKSYNVEICSVSRIDWLRNAAGLTDINYWKGTLHPRPTVDWYLERIEAAMENIKQRTDGAPITLVAHSAGGWLGRLYMKDYGTTGMDAFITLGSPHSPPPDDVPGVIDQTRGILSFCQQEIPGCYHSDVHYVTVAGKYVKGSKWNAQASIGEKITGIVYKQVCGKADVWGDGIVPNEASHLEGAINIELADVYHSPVGSSDEVDDQSRSRQWYGSRDILEQWIEHLEPIRSGN